VNRRPLALLAAFILLAALGGCGRASDELEKMTREARPAFTLSGEELFRDYSDRDAGDKKYKEKILQVSGPVVRIRSNVANDRVLLLRGAEHAGDIQCHFFDSYSEQVSKLRPGDKLTVRGKCTGKIINVILDPCVIIP